MKGRPPRSMPTVVGERTFAKVRLTAAASEEAEDIMSNAVPSKICRLDQDKGVMICAAGGGKAKASGLWSQNCVNEWTGRVDLLQGENSGNRRLKENCQHQGQRSGHDGK